jgi:hypothetical protein
MIILPKASWIVENKMGFACLYSYLYAIYFLNANINAEFSTHVTNMTCMVNVYHPLVSMLMLKKLNSENMPGAT